MYVTRYGSGPRVFFGLHGWSGTHDSFAPLAARMPDDVALYCADMPGYGRSAAPREWSLRAIAQEISAAISSIDAPSVTVIGNCSGAIFGLLAAEHAEERVGRFVLIDPFAFVPWYFNLFVARSWGRYAYNSTFANPVGRWVTNLSLRRRRAETSDLTRSFRSVNHETAYRYLELMSRIDGVSRFRDLRAPVDIVYGERTFAAVKRSVAMWQAVWPQARAFELKGAGHLPISEATDRLSEVAFAARKDFAHRVSILC
ncbi:MAG TPA: alpha/beta fold hydrolase [Blastocatellia bacterium]|nr:alpha/beta fold hydrolase [Blastocatellia bacterium]